MRRVFVAAICFLSLVTPFNEPLPGERGCRLPSVAETDLTTQIDQLGKSLESIEAVADLPRLRAEIAQLAEEVAAPDLWDDQENAQRVTSTLSARQAEVERLEGLRHVSTTPL